MEPKELEEINKQLQEMRDMLDIFDKEVVTYSHLAARKYIKPVKGVIFNAVMELIKYRNSRIAPQGGMICDPDDLKDIIDKFK